MYTFYGRRWCAFNFLFVVGFTGVTGKHFQTNIALQFMQTVTFCFVTFETLFAMQHL
jgi:hypothetical protein